MSLKTNVTNVFFKLWTLLKSVIYDLFSPEEEENSSIFTNREAIGFISLIRIRVRTNNSFSEEKYWSGRRRVNLCKNHLMRLLSQVFSSFFHLPRPGR